MNKILMAALEKLDADEPIRLAYGLLESVVAATSAAPITDAPRQETRRHLADYRSNPDEPVGALADIRRQLGVAQSTADISLVEAPKSTSSEKRPQAAFCRPERSEGPRRHLPRVCFVTSDDEILRRAQDDNLAVIPSGARDLSFLQSMAAFPSSVASCKA